MKKVLVILLSLAVLMSVLFVGGVGAAKQLTETDQTKPVPVSVEITGAKYTVIIPESIVLNPTGAPVTESVSVSEEGLILTTNSVLTVKVSSTNGWKVMFTDTSSSPSKTYEATYDLKVSGGYTNTLDSGTTGTTAGTVLQYNQHIPSSMASTLSFSLTGDIQSYGTYSDTLEFSVTVAETSPTSE